MRKAEQGKAIERCDGCIFGRPIIIEVKRGKGADAKKEQIPMCECHVARPTRNGFPTVRLDDFCSLHVDAETCERSFAGLTPNTTAFL